MSNAEKAVQRAKTRLPEVVVIKMYEQQVKELQEKISRLEIQKGQDEAYIQELEQANKDLFGTAKKATESQKLIQKEIKSTPLYKNIKNLLQIQRDKNRQLKKTNRELIEKIVSLENRPI